MSSISLLICLIILSLLSVSKAEDETPEMLEYRHQVQEQLPDIGNKTVARRLRCSSCKVVLNEMQSALRTLKQQRTKKKPTEVEIVEAMEKVCDVAVPDYGLQLRNNKPTEIFSKDEQISRAQGTWILRFLQDRCGELFNDHSDTILQHLEEEETILHEKICVKHLKYCKKDEIGMKDDL